MPGPEQSGDDATHEGGPLEAVAAEASPAERTSLLPGATRVEAIRGFVVEVVEGPRGLLGRRVSGDRCAIGSHELNALVIDDPTVSRFHCEVRLEDGVPVVSDLKSRNGTIVDGVQVREAVLRDGSTLRIGPTVVRFQALGESGSAAPPEATRFGSLVGVSPAMRRTLAMLERAAGSDVTVLLEGETGTGKGRAAEAIHQGSGRKEQPFLVVDCGAIPANLLESELFGHEKGAFTGADSRRIGAFEEASRGTLFLDEIGEMPAELQPKLLRALENREVRRVGTNRFIPVDLRVIAATNRDLRSEVNAGRFRSDLYFRLAVAKIAIPSLRERPEDIGAIVRELLENMGTPPEARARLLMAPFIEQLRVGAWPGNVRELRNYLERCLVFEDVPAERGTAAPAGDVVPYVEAKKLALDAFEREYLQGLLRRFSGKVAQAAQAAGVDRVYLYRLLRRQGIKPTS